ncbi:hypothetical protein C8J57DRAFT_1597553, partial [Mycena rebaudengoi]
SLQSIPVDSSVPRKHCNWAENLFHIGPCNLRFCDGDHECYCSATAYFLAAACEYCSDNPPISWMTYAEKYKCDGEPRLFPTALPALSPNSSIPAWAINLPSQVPTPIVMFDPALAKSLAAALPSTNPIGSSSPPGSSGSSSRVLSTSSSHTSSENSAGPTANLATRASLQAGPIAGGVIGSISFITLVGLVIWCTLLRRRRHVHPIEITGFDTAEKMYTSLGPASTPFPFSTNLPRVSRKGLPLASPPHTPESLSLSMSATQLPPNPTPPNAEPTALLRIEEEVRVLQIQVMLMGADRQRSPDSRETGYDRDMPPEYRSTHATSTSNTR